MNIYIYLHYLIIHWLIPGTIHYDFAQKLTIEKHFFLKKYRFVTEKKNYLYFKYYAWTWGIIYCHYNFM